MRPAHCYPLCQIIVLHCLSRILQGVAKEEDCTSCTLCAPILRKHERLVFEEAVAIRKDDWGDHQPTCDAIVKVFKSTLPGSGINDSIFDEDTILRAAVYHVKLASYAEVTITGSGGLRQVRICSTRSTPSL